MSATLAEGTIFAGRYRLVRCIATGGMGAVYEAVHLETERRRALKVMHAHLFQSDEMRERFKREARISSQVESEFIVDVSDAGVDEATRMPFLVMELLRGEELGVRLKRAGRFPPGEVVTYLQQTAWALDKTHAASIVHRDLKPENLFLTHREDGSPRIKILDFGVAKLVAESGTAAGATRSLGTPLYMAPEQFRAGTKLTPAADIYALGMMAYTLLVGEPYWRPEATGAGDVIAFAMTAVHGPQEPATQRAAARGVALPPAFDGWFMRVTAVNPAGRFPTASEAVRVLGEVLVPSTGSSYTAPPATPAMTGQEGGYARSPSPAGMTTPIGVKTPVSAAAVGAWGPAVAPAASASGEGVSHPSQPASGARPDPTTLVLERVATSTGAATAPAPIHGSRGPFVAVLAVLGLSVLAVGAWIGLRATGSGPSGSPTSTHVPASSTAVSATSVAETTATAAVEAALSVEPTPPAAPVAPAPSSSTSARAPTVTRPAMGKAPPAKPSATPVTKATATPLLGRD